MSKILFTDAQVKKLSKNKWIKNITNKGITYSDEFKYKLVKECENYKKFPQDVFRECGINPEIVGERRISNSAYRWRKQLNSIGEITDTRKESSAYQNHLDTVDSITIQNINDNRIMEFKSGKELKNYFGLKGHDLVQYIKTNQILMNEWRIIDKSEKNIKFNTA